MSDGARELLIGIDGGGSKTVALVADTAGVVLGRGSAGASNYQTIGAESAFAALEHAIQQALGCVAGEACTPRAICLGLAGVGRQEDVALFERWANSQWPAAPVSVVNDAEVALAAGTPDGWGLALICGTGSIVIGRDQGGRLARAGGWGYLFGDEGSGYALGIGALRAIARAADGRGPQTALTEAVLAHWSLGEPMHMIPRVYRGQPSNHEIAAVASLVHSAALAGDRVACELIDEACEELAEAAASVARQLGFQGPIPCALAGGLLSNATLLAEGVIRAAGQRGITLAPCTPVTEPAYGAIVIARRSIEFHAALAR